MPIFKRLFNSKEETNKIIAEYGEEEGNLFIKLWIQRSLRIYVSERTIDFQFHLIDVLLDDFDRKIEKKYDTAISMKFKLFLSEVDSDKLYKEQLMNRLVTETMKEIEESAAESRHPIQQETYNWLLINYEI